MTAASIARRVREIRSRAAVRAWEYRQRKHAHGVWFRLRRLLAQSREAYAISADDAQALLDEGRSAEAVGFELAPAKTIIFVTPARIAALEHKEALTLRLDRELLAAQCIALVPW